ncbi:MAG: hypothetical protein HOY71_18490 [Nonomuraea sp.]|nr:hypothetical protein [Nonomuraea sp.]
MRTIIIVLAAASTVAACGVTDTSAVALTQARSACSAAVAIVAPFRERAAATRDDHPDDAEAMRKAFMRLTEDAAQTYVGADWRAAMSDCEDGGSRADVSELRMWNVDVAIANLDVTNDTHADEAIDELLTKLDRALTLDD